MMSESCQSLQIMSIENLFIHGTATREAKFVSGIARLDAELYFKFTFFTNDNKLLLFY